MALISSSRDKHHQRTALQRSSYARHLQVVQLLIARGANLNTSGSPRGRKKMTSFELAVTNGHLEVKKVLLDAGACFDEETKTACVLAATGEGHIAAVRRVREVSEGLEPA
jgi:Ankyrin repeat